MHAHINRSRIWIAISCSVAMVSSGLGAQTTSETNCTLSHQDFVADNVEACIQMLREWPASDSYPEMMEDAGQAVDFNAPPPTTGFKVINVGGKDLSTVFTRCIKRADPSYEGSTTTSVGLPVSGSGTSTPRYRYTDMYQRHELRDAKDRIVYKLVRIGRGIEAMGDASGAPVHGSYEASSDCRNSYGDPCGTEYLRTRAGTFEKF